MRRKIMDNDSAFADVMLHLFNATDPTTPEEVAEELCSVGLDPQSVGEMMMTVAKKAMAMAQRRMDLSDKQATDNLTGALRDLTKAVLSLQDAMGTQCDQPTDPQPNPHDLIDWAEMMTRDVQELRAIVLRCLGHYVTLQTKVGQVLPPRYDSAQTRTEVQV
jgi:hypothetical protein